MAAAAHTDCLSSLSSRGCCPNLLLYGCVFIGVVNRLVRINKSNVDDHGFNVAATCDANLKLSCFDLVFIQTSLMSVLEHCMIR